MTDVSAVHPEDRRAAPERCVCYLDRLPLTVDERREVQQRIAATPDAVAAGAHEALAALHGFLSGPALKPREPAPPPLGGPPEFWGGPAAPPRPPPPGGVRVLSVPPPPP